MQCRKKNRLEFYDYSQEGFYFITICVKDRKNIFGKINGEEMILNEFGKVAEKCWLDITSHSRNIFLDEFIIMPNHIHGIIIIDYVGNRHTCSLHNRRQGAKLSLTIGSFKSAVSKHINQQSQTKFHWQKSFYDHIIRSEYTLNKIREYILNNPLKWSLDKENILR